MRWSVGSLFSGVGGFELGFEAAGFRVAWQVEIDEDAVSVLERHYPNVRRYRDVREVKGADLEPVDVLVGGFPCQDLSVAGARKGLAGERSGLFFEVARLAAETAAPWLLLENVPGLLSSFTPVEPPPRDVPPGAEWTVEETSDLGVVLSTLAEYGYGWCYRVLDAQYFGVPQRRERVFIVGCLGDSGARAVEVLLEPESVLRDLATCIEAGQGTAVVPEVGAGGGGVADTLRSHPRPGSNSSGAIVPDTAYTLRHNTNGSGSSDNAWNTTYVPAVSGTLTAGDPQDGQNALRGMLIPAGIQGIGDANALNTKRVDDASVETFIVANSVQASEGHHGRRSPRGDGSDNLVAAFDPVNVTSGAIRTRCEPGLPANTLHQHGQAVAFHATQSPVDGHVSPAFGASAQIGVADLGVSHSLTTRYGVTEDGTGRGTPLAASPEGASVRRLMPVECERLMGWPDGHTERRADGSLIPDGPRYRMIGNGVVAPVARWIGERLRAVLEGAC